MADDRELAGLLDGVLELSAALRRQVGQFLDLPKEPPRDSFLERTDDGRERQAEDGEDEPADRVVGVGVDRQLEPASTVSPVSSGTGVRCCIRYVVMTPPLTTQRQQQQLPICTPGRAERIPMNKPPSSEG